MLVYHFEIANMNAREIDDMKWSIGQERNLWYCGIRHYRTYMTWGSHGWEMPMVALRFE